MTGILRVGRLMQVDDSFGDIDVVSALAGRFPIEACQSVGFDTVIDRYLPDGFFYQFTGIASADNYLSQHQRGRFQPDGG